MEFTKKAAVIMLIMVIGINCPHLSASPDSTQTPVKILFIGSSYFLNNDLPALFKNLAESSGKLVLIYLQTAGGPYLSDHANSSLTEAKINQEEWDYVVLQGVGRLTAYPEFYTDHPVYPALVKLHKKISENRESTKMVFCLPWAYEDGMTWLQGWTDTYEDMQLKIYENTLQYSDSVGFVIAPVGWAWNTVLKEKRYPLHYLHISDWNHPSPRGSYLMACVIFSTIFKCSVDNGFYSDLPKEEAGYFQTIASNTVMDNLELWNIITAITGINTISFPLNFHLYQNYPNPFNAGTTINYELSKSSFVELAVYDVLGKNRNILVNKEQLPGNYTVRFDGSDLTSGLYFYRLRCGHRYQTGKMLLIK